jgi:hypothetical protein
MASRLKVLPHIDRSPLCAVRLLKVECRELSSSVLLLCSACLRRKSGVRPFSGGYEFHSRRSHLFPFRNGEASASPSEVRVDYDDRTTAHKGVPFTTIIPTDLHTPSTQRAATSPWMKGVWVDTTNILKSTLILLCEMIEITIHFFCYESPGPHMKPRVGTTAYKGSIQDMRIKFSSP